MIKITGIIITYNEEKRIKRCIESIIPVVDELIVVDSFSTDATEEICKKFEALKFYKRKFDGFSDQKNWAIHQAQNPVILSLDADEILSIELQKDIISLKQNWNCDAYYCNRLNNYCGKWIRHGGWYPDKKIRLWDSRHGLWNKSVVHESIEFDKNTKIGHIKENILHYSYETIYEHIQQLNKYTDLSASDLQSRNKKVSLVKILFHSGWKFIQDYFVKLGLLDGYYGFVIAVISSFSTFLKYIKLRELYRKSNCSGI